MRVVRSCGLLLALVLLVPRFASAQASITGTVKDPSGAVLPGVTVESREPGPDSRKSARPSPTEPGSTGSSTCAPAPTP